MVFHLPFYDVFFCVCVFLSPVWPKCLFLSVLGSSSFQWNFPHTKMRLKWKSKRTIVILVYLCECVGHGIEDCGMSGKKGISKSKNGNAFNETVLNDFFRAVAGDLILFPFNPPFPQPAEFFFLSFILPLNTVPVYTVFLYIVTPWTTHPAQWQPETIVSREKEKRFDWE